jgi:uncharacterized protein (UPF0261 family)
VKTIAVIGTLDTKGPELEFLVTEITRRGAQPLLIDTGLFAHDRVPAITADDVAARAGTTVAHLRDANDRGDAVRMMGIGARAIVAELHLHGRIDGAIAAGGSGNTSIAATAMDALPIGVPKLIVSTMAAGDVSAYVGTSDLTLMHSVTDIEGLNRLSRTILSNAAAAVCAMASPGPRETRFERPVEGASIALTMFGVTTPAAKRIRALLEARGFEVIVFHAVGAGGRAMERLIAEGVVSGVIDLTTTEIADEVIGGVLGAGPDRLRAAVAQRLPQVIAPGALDIVNFGPRSSVPARFAHRTLVAHNPQVTLMRTTPEENVRVARFIAERLVDADPNLTTLCLPLRGVSALDAEGERFDDPDANRHLFGELDRLLGDRLRVVRIDAHINDGAFADEVVRRFLTHWSHARPEARTPHEALT